MWLLWYRHNWHNGGSIVVVVFLVIEGILHPSRVYVSSLHPLSFSFVVCRLREKTMLSEHELRCRAATDLLHK